MAMAPLELIKPFTPPSALPSLDASSGSIDEDICSVAPRAARCRHPGRRIIGRRIYDSVLGVSCHWCRQKTVEDHVFCCHCTIAFCGGCLRNRHGEDIEIEMQEGVEWTCPKCRGGCGADCKNCCNCGPCRKAQGLEPTGLLVHTARASGFTNVHDYLIYLKTGECEEIIARRKTGKGWCQTDHLSFCKKQKRIEDENAVEASCRKRLNFDSKACQSQERRHSKSRHVNALQRKETGPTATTSKEESLQSIQELRSKEGEKLSSSSSSASASQETVVLQLKPVPHEHVQEDLRSQPKIALEMAVALQLKPEPEFDALEESRRDVTTSLQGRDRDVHLGVPSLSGQDFVPPPSAFTEQSSYSLHRIEVKKEQYDPLVQMKGDASNVLLKVKTEPELVDHETSVCRLPVMEQQWDEVDKTNGERSKNVSQLMQEKAETHEDGSQPCFDRVGTSTNSQETIGNTSSCKFSLDFVVPAENIEPRSSKLMSSSLNDGTHKGSEILSPFISNFHLYPESSNFHLYPGNSNPYLCPESPTGYKNSNFRLCPKNLTPVPEEAVEKDLKVQKFRVKLENLESQGAHCNTDSYEDKIMMGCKDARCLGHARTDNFVPLATTKEEREDVHFPAPTSRLSKSIPPASSLFSTVKVKVEREDACFTIEPALQYPSNFMARNFNVKEEANVATGTSNCIDDDNQVQTLPTMKQCEISAGLEKSCTGSFGDVSHLWKADDYRCKLEARLLESFSRKELDMLTTAVSHRKPMYKARETRQGSSLFVSEEEGYSYLDHHPDFAARLEECDSPIGRLSLLRGFFFWLEHASTQGAFKPWTFTSQLVEAQDNDDCVEIDGPDCEILAVVCSVD